MKIVVVYDRQWSRYGKTIASRGGAFTFMFDWDQDLAKSRDKVYPPSNDESFRIVRKI